MVDGSLNGRRSLACDEKKRLIDAFERSEELVSFALERCQAAPAGEIHRDQKRFSEDVRQQWEISRDRLAAHLAWHGC
jgi:hypothetical protein